MKTRDFTVEPHYREASAKGPVEDGYAVNNRLNMFAVCDGVSGPYSPSNPKLIYEGGLTGGQMVKEELLNAIKFVNFARAQSILRLANSRVLVKHLRKGEDPEKEAVAGACTSVCEISVGIAKFIVVGDCFVEWKDNDGFHFLTNFDWVALEFERKGDAAFEKCLKEAGGDKGKAWDLYFPYFSEKQYFRANKNLGKGGHAMLNGDFAIEECWTKKEIFLSKTEWILLGTDGLLPGAEFLLGHWETLSQELGDVYEKGGIDEIVKWRDELSRLPHIDGYPEAAAVEIKFS